MKKIFKFLAFVIMINANAQAPQGFNYQATVRNSSGSLIVNQNVNFRFNIMLNSQTSTPVFSEIHYLHTDNLGQVNLVIGQGVATIGTFSTINWGNGTYYLGIELNTGNGYIPMGTTQLLSVPYALYANKSGVATTPNLASVLAINNSANNSKISNLADPTDPKDAVTKAYLDAKIPNGTVIGDNLSWNGTNWVATSANTYDKFPKLTTSIASGITPFLANSGGIITSDGGYSIISKGICWSISPNPTINDNFSSNGAGATSFNSILNNLLPGTNYYYRAYATNTIGTGYGMSYVLTTLGKPTLSTVEISQKTSTTAVSGGNITSNGGVVVTSSGICWSVNPNPTVNLTTKTIGNSDNGVFSSSITGLAAGTTYYVRAYATNEAGTGYGQEITFTTLVALPTITTTAATSITSATALSGGNVSSNGGGVISARGVVWSTISNPTITTNLGFTSNGTSLGSFTSNLTGLAAGTTYYVRAYATNAAGTGYGQEITFTSSVSLPTLTTEIATSITSVSAVCGGNISSNGGGTISSKGIVWSTSTNPTISSNLGYTTNIGNSIGSFVSNLTGLTVGATYFVRAYATNSAGTAYGNQISFTPLSNITIGTQIWQNTNLDVATYNDGTPIPQVENFSEWSNLTTGAWCYYSSSTSNGTVYGKLYNWYAVAGIHDNDPNTPNKVLAPLGWHIPSDGEWTTLTTFLGVNAGGKLKMTGTTRWKTPNTGATNSTNFSALPGGIRIDLLSFYFLKELGLWWSSTETVLDNVPVAYYRSLSSTDGNVSRSYQYKNTGLSVRCIKN